MAHCNIPSSEENPPSRSASSSTPTVVSWVSDILIKSPSSFAVDQNRPPEDDLFTVSALAITDPTDAKKSSHRVRPEDALHPITFFTEDRRLLCINYLRRLVCLILIYIIPLTPGNHQVTEMGNGAHGLYSR